MKPGIVFNPIQTGKTSGLVAQDSAHADSADNADKVDGKHAAFFAPITTPSFNGNVQMPTGGLNVSGGTGFPISSMVDVAGSTNNKIHIGNQVVFHNNGVNFGWLRLNPDGSVNEWLVMVSLVTGEVTFPSSRMGLGQTGETWRTINVADRIANSTGDYPVMLQNIVVRNSNGVKTRWADMRIDGQTIVRRVVPASGAKVLCESIIVPKNSNWQVYSENVSDITVDLVWVLD